MTRYTPYHEQPERMIITREELRPLYDEIDRQGKVEASLRGELGKIKSEHHELVEAKRRIASLERELSELRRAQANVADLSRTLHETAVAAGKRTALRPVGSEEGS